MKKSNKNQTITPLRQAVINTDDVKSSFCSGLGALLGVERKKIKVPDSRKITGSVDIDSSTKDIYPNDNRWDYAVEYDDETFFIEIHPVATNEVQTVIAKLKWLKWWLCNKATSINAVKSVKRNPYHWISTGSIAISPTSKYVRMLAQMNLKPAKLWDYSAIPVEEQSLRGRN